MERPSLTVSCIVAKPTFAKCHPDRLNRSNELCAKCYQRQWYNKHRPSRKLIYRRWELKKLYGLSEQGYKELLEFNQGLCHLCDSPTDKLNVDHDHKTGHVRGLLCQTCNIALGYYELIAENPKLLEYLTNNLSQGKKGSIKHGT